METIFLFLEWAELGPLNLTLAYIFARGTSRRFLVKIVSQETEDRPVHENCMYANYFVKAEMLILRFTLSNSKFFVRKCFKASIC